MILPCLAIDQYVIKKNQDELPEIWSEYSIHQALECGGGVGEPEWHYHKLVVTLMCTKGRLWDIVFLYPNLVIP